MRPITRFIALAFAALLPASSMAASATGTVTVNVLAPLSLGAPEINFGNVRQGESAQLEVAVSLSAAAGHNVVLESTHDCDPALGFSLPERLSVSTSGGTQEVKINASLAPAITPKTRGIQHCSYTITANYH